MKRGRDWSYPRRAIELKERLKDYEIVLSSAPVRDQKWDIVHYIPFKADIIQQGAPIKIAYMGNFGYWEHIKYGKGLKDAIKMVDFAIFQDKFLYETALKKGTDKSKIAIVKPGIDLNKFKIEIKIGIAARLKRRSSFHKGEEELLNLFKLSRWENFKFIFAGKFWEQEYGEKYKATGVNIEFLDRVPYHWMPDFYNRMDYLLVSSRFESGPLVFAEALACGRPVISRKVGFTPEYNAIFYDTVDELVKILKGIEKNFIERRKQVENLTWDNWAKEHDRIYKGVVLCSSKRN